jgi:DNA-directed RNA polymerase specialized sigma24 family protein
MEAMPALLLFAVRRSSSHDEATDLLHEAYVAIREGRRTYDAAAGASFFGFACGVMKSIRSHRRSRAAARRETEFLEERDDMPPSSRATNPEKLHAAREDEDARWKQVRASLAGDHVGLAVLELLRAHVADAREQAARIGVSVSAIYDARDRIKRAAARSAKRVDDVDDDEKRETP